MEKTQEVIQQELFNSLKGQLFQLLGETINLNKNIIKVKRQPTIKVFRNPEHQDYNKFMEWFHSNNKPDTFKLATDRQQKWKAKRIKEDSDLFKEWLKHFGSMKDLTNFLKRVKSESGQCAEFVNFFKEIQDWLLVYNKEYKPKYHRYMTWLNQTIYSKRFLIDIMYQTYFGNDIKKVTRTIEYKGITAKPMKSKLRQLKDEGTNKEYTHKLQVNDTFVSDQMKTKAKYYGIHKSVDKQMYQRGYGIFKTFAFKYLYRRNEHKKNLLQKEAEKQSSKIQKMQDKGQDVYLLKGYIWDKTKDTEPLDITLYMGDVTKNIKQIKKVLRRKYYANLIPAIQKGDTVVDVGHKSKLADINTVVEQFVEDFKKLK